jgi:hypothetical protein
MRYDVPQTVADAVDNGWEWVGVQCVYCRRKHRVQLSGQRRTASLASVVG